jgi:hypothetical protein
LLDYYDAFNNDNLVSWNVNRVQRVDLNTSAKAFVIDRRFQLKEFSMEVESYSENKCFGDTV